MHLPLNQPSLTVWTPIGMRVKIRKCLDELNSMMWRKHGNVNFGNFIDSNLNKSLNSFLLVLGAPDCPAFIFLLSLLFLYCVVSPHPAGLLYPHLYTVYFLSVSSTRYVSSPWALSFPSSLLPPLAWDFQSPFHSSGLWTSPCSQRCTCRVKKNTLLDSF